MIWRWLQPSLDYHRRPKWNLWPKGLFVQWISQPWFTTKNVDLYKYVYIAILFVQWISQPWFTTKIRSVQIFGAIFAQRVSKIWSVVMEEREVKDVGLLMESMANNNVHMYHLVLIGKVARQDIQVKILITDQVSLAGNTTNWKRAFFRHCEQFIVSTSVGGWTIAEEEWMLLWCQK